MWWPRPASQNNGNSRSQFDDRCDELTSNQRFCKEAAFIKQIINREPIALKFQVPLNENNSASIETVEQLLEDAEFADIEFHFASPNGDQKEAQKI